MMYFDSSDGMESEPSTSTVQWLQPCRKFELQEILLATENFNESFVIGKGGFGKVYRGEVIIGTSHVVAAIKRLDLMSDQGAAEFWAEVEMLSKLRHSHLVSLIGYCNYEREMILVYEYMPNGTLEDHLHKLRTRLSWVDRLKICIGAARGLDYLHTGTGIEFGVIHRDVKSSNILLNESWAAKISDFGLSRICGTNQPRTYVDTLVKGTFGYFDPNYFATGQLTRKSDVYAFGVVLLEVLCQKRPLDRSLECGLATWAQDSIKEGNLKNIVDPDIRGEISPKCLKGFARIAERCLEYHPKHRPTMTEIIFSLESVLTLQQKTNNWLQTPGKSIFTKMIGVFPFNSNGENPVTINDPSSTTAKGSSDSGAAATSSGEHVSPSGKIVTPNLKSFTYSEIRSITRHFMPDIDLWPDGFGMFKGWVDGQTYAPSKVGIGMAVAVNTVRGAWQWQEKIKFIGKFSHPNLVKLVGYCLEDVSRLKDGYYLHVYEYMPNRSLQYHLFNTRRSAKDPLSWSRRIKIATGAAQGLAFLHTTETTAMYEDFNSAKILLDGEFNAKLYDFGFAKPAEEDYSTDDTWPASPSGHEDPEYIATGHLYVESDVYGFGVVLLEILTGRRAFDSNRIGREQNLVDWARPLLPNKQKLRMIIDPCLEHDIPQNAARGTAKLILNCLEREPKNRPSMKEVLVSLQQIGSIKKIKTEENKGTLKPINGHTP